MVATIFKTSFPAFLIESDIPAILEKGYPFPALMQKRHIKTAVIGDINIK